MKSLTRAAGMVLFVALVLSASGCGGGSPQTQPPPHESTWTWVSGAKALYQSGVYGTQGTASPSNMPGARDAAVSWKDSSGHFWLFGGSGVDSAGTLQHALNDLWKFDGANWTWVSGSDLADQPGVYGTKGVASPSNVPGARFGSISWIDKSNNLWLFGGEETNDLWKFDGANWTWISGSNLFLQAGVYGTQGTASPANVPGGRGDSVSWIDGSGNLWLFGGFGADSVGGQGDLNDLWKFDGTNWTWVSGSNLITQPGVYGTKGAPSSSNVPGTRYQAVSWIDKSGNLWLFSGIGRDSNGAPGNLNDLWKFDDTNWTWVSGSNVVSQSGVYGTKGTPSSSNVPGARNTAVSWTDSSGNLWLFGGFGNDSTGNVAGLNDLWKFDGTNWTWMGGSQLGYGTGNYGILGTASVSNLPASRSGAVSWIDASGNVWLFGGIGRDPAGAYAIGDLNDLWRYTP